MTTWLACAEGFIAADIVRWQEGIWERRGPRGRKPMKLGDREVIAEVIDGPDAEGWVTLLVIECGLVVGADGFPPRSGSLKAGERLRRKAATLARGGVGRMAWSDEAARSTILGSKFMRRGSTPTAHDDARGA